MCWDFDYEKPIDYLNDFQQVSHVQNSVFQIQTEIGFLLKQFGHNDLCR